MLDGVKDYAGKEKKSLPAIASAMAGPQNACMERSSICVRLCCQTRFHLGTVRAYSSMFILSSITSYEGGALSGSLPLVRRASSLPPAWVFEGAASKFDILNTLDRWQQANRTRLNSKTGGFRG